MYVRIIKLMFEKVKEKLKLKDVFEDVFEFVGGMEVESMCFIFRNVK